MTIREARTNLCKIITAGEPVVIHKGKGWRPAAVAIVLTIPQLSGRGTEAAQRRRRQEAMHQQVIAAMKGEGRAEN